MQHARRARRASWRCHLPTLAACLTVFAVSFRLALGPGPELPDEALVSPAAARAHATLQSLRADNASTFELFHQRRAALAEVLAGDGALARRWARRLAAARPRGVAITAGNAGPMSNAFVVTYVLRKTLGCRLPLVIMHWGAAEVAPGVPARFRAHGLDNVEFVDAAADYPAHHRPMWRNGVFDPLVEEPYKVKLAGLYSAPFREALMLDSDSLPLQDPAALFEVPAYRRHGSLFWPDLRAGRPELWDLLLETLGADLWEAGPPTWDDPSGERGPSRALGGAGGAGGGGGRAGARRMSLVKLAPHPPPAPPPPPTWLVQRQAESGQILIDRRRHWRALEWALFLNTHDSVVYRLPGMLGDKDTYRAALALAGALEDFQQVPHAPGLAVVDRHTPPTQQSPRFAYAGLVQFHPLDGTPLFHHRTDFSKFPASCASIHPGFHAGPLTHVSPPSGLLQSGLFEHQAGLAEWQAAEVTCGRGGNCPECDLARPWAEVDEACFPGRDDADKDARPEPVTLVALPEGSPARAASAAAKEAHRLLLGDASPGCAPPAARVDPRRARHGSRAGGRWHHG